MAKFNKKTHVNKVKPHLRHTKKCLETKTFQIKETEVSQTSCTKTKEIVHYVIAKQMLNVMLYKRWFNNKCIECGKKIDRKFPQTLTCATCESKKIHLKFW